MFMATEAERQICTAPPGKFLLVQVDPRDHWPTRQGKPKTRKGVQRALKGMMSAQRDVMRVYNDKGQAISV